MEELANQGLTVLYESHDMEATFRVSDLLGQLLTLVGKPFGGVRPFEPAGA